MVIQINSVLLLFLFLFYFIFREVIEIKSVPIKRYHLRTSICQKPFKISAAVIPGCQRGLFRTTCWKTSLCCPVLCPADVCILSSIQADIRNNWGHTSHEPTLHLLSVGTDGRMRMCFFFFLIQGFDFSSVCFCLLRPFPQTWCFSVYLSIWFLSSFSFLGLGHIYHFMVYQFLSSVDC